MTIPESWQNCAEAILSNLGSVLVMGEGMSGKTSFVTYLAQEGSRRGIKTAVLDMDIGQSNIGPPTAMGLGFVKDNINSLSDIKSEGIYFIGHTSPVGKEKKFATGLKGLLPLGNSAELLIIESVAFFKNKDFRNKMLALEIEIIRPYHIVVLKENSSYEEKKTPEGGSVFSLPGIIKKGKRNLIHRKRFRVESWTRYLTGGGVRSFPLRDVINSPLWQLPAKSKVGFPVGILDGEGNHLAVGVIFAVESASVSIFAPPIIACKKSAAKGRWQVVMGEVKVEKKVLDFIRECVGQ